MSYIPIFIIVHDRDEILKKSVESYEKLIKTPYKIVFHDSKSTYEPTIAYLKQMEEKGYEVYWSEINKHTNVVNSVRNYLKKHPECQYYVITDPDIELDNVNGDILEFYSFLLNKYKVRCVGPMLRIDDIPEYYPKKAGVLHRHRRQFWRKKPREILYNEKTYTIQFSAIDTTFQLCSRNRIPSKFPNKNGIRCYSPYSARHLDWYIDPKNMTECQIYYADNANKTSHWGRGIKKQD